MLGRLPEKKNENEQNKCLRDDVTGGPQNMLLYKKPMQRAISLIVEDELSREMLFSSCP